MKTTLHLIIGLIFSSSVFAQTYYLDWGTSFSPAWANGATSGTANNIGGSGVNCSVSIVKSGGSFTNVGGPTSPTVTGTSVTVPSTNNTNNIQIALDYSTATQYTNITFNFSTLVYGVRFYLADIDRLDPTSNSYFDQITVTGSTGFTGVNPTITKYDPTTDPNFLIISGNVARVNSASNVADNTKSDATDQRGTIKVDFGSSGIASLTIRYDNYTGVMADPGKQFIAIGNVRFVTTPILPVELTSFEGQRGNGVNILKWKTVSESKMAYYAIESSKTGRDFSEIGQVESFNSTTAKEYTFIDKAIGSDNYYYRLKLMNNDGSFTYSKTVLVHFDELTEIKVFPTLFKSSLTLRIPSSKQEMTKITVVDISGKTVYNHNYKVNQGINEFSIELPASLSPGQYFVVMGNSKSIGIIKQ